MNLNEHNNGKWAEHEVDDIIKYIMENPDFEKPNEEVFYKKLIEETKITKNWTAVHAKLHSMKRRYLNAHNWIKRANKNSMNHVEKLQKVRTKIQSMCPYFIELNFIFGKNDKRISRYFPEIEYAEYEFRDQFSNASSTTDTFSSDSSELPSTDSDGDETESEADIIENGFAGNSKSMDPDTLIHSLEMMKQLIYRRGENMRKRQALYKKKFKSYKKQEHKKFKALEEHFLSKLSWEEQMYELRKKEIKLNENFAINQIKNKYEIER